MDSYLDWHHSNIRAGASQYFFRQFFYKNMTGMDPPKDSIKEALMILHKSCALIEKIWLHDKYLFGAEPSIADLSLACELA